MWHLIVGLSRACDYGGPTTTTPPPHTPSQPPPAHRALAKLCEREREGGGQLGESCGEHSNVGVQKFVLLISAGPCCHFPLCLDASIALLLLLLHDRGAVGAAGVRDTCQQGDRVSSQSVPCPSHSHVNWQPASADYRHCGSKRSPLWQWQAYDLQDTLILSNRYCMWRPRHCYPSPENR